MLKTVDNIAIRMIRNDRKGKTTPPNPSCYMNSHMEGLYNVYIHIYIYIIYFTIFHHISLCFPTSLWRIFPWISSNFFPKLCFRRSVGKACGACRDSARPPRMWRRPGISQEGGERMYQYTYKSLGIHVCYIYITWRGWSLWQMWGKYTIHGCFGNKPMCWHIILICTVYIYKIYFMYSMIWA